MNSKLTEIGTEIGTENWLKLGLIWTEAEFQAKNISVLDLEEFQIIFWPNLGSFMEITSQNWNQFGPVSDWNFQSFCGPFQLKISMI